MIIGEDFPKIEFEMLGLELVEPNAFIGDTILFLTAIYFAFKIAKYPHQSTFTKNWRLFFLIFGVSFLFGGIGHTFYNYLGIAGKYPSWHLGIVAIYFLEKAMISLHPEEAFRKRFYTLILVQMLTALIAEIAVCMFVDLEPDVSLGLKVPSLNSFIGLFFGLGVLGLKYVKLYGQGFYYFFVSLFVLVPAAVSQTVKLNFAQWFDRNDLSHLSLLFGLIFYYKGVDYFQKIRSYKND